MLLICPRVQDKATEMEQKSVYLKTKVKLVMQQTDMPVVEMQSALRNKILNTM